MERGEEAMNEMIRRIGLQYPARKQAADTENR